VGLFAVRFYRSRIRFLGVPWRVPAVLLLLLVLAGEMGATLWQILQAGREGLGQATAHWAHIGGFLLGMGWAQVSRQYEAGHREYMADDARSALDRGAPLAAVRRWEAVLAAQPDNLEAKAELARAWAAAGDRTEAVMHYRLAVMALLKANRKADAAVRYAEMAASYPDETFPPAEQLALAAALEERGNYAAAKTAFELLARAHPDAPEAERARLRRGVLLLKRLKDPAAAADALAEFLRRHPDSEWRGYAEDLLRSAL
jgi:tetratricopeptide (TPR) repeat protein